MKRRYGLITVVVAVDFFLLAVAYVLRNQALFGICDHPYAFNDYIGCLDPLSHAIGKPLYLFAIRSSIVVPFLFFINDAVFRRWSFFSLVWLWLSFTIIIITPEYLGGWINIGPDRDDMAAFMAWLFVIISLAMMIRDSFRGKKANRKGKSA